jgi:hypothetical protein
MFESDDDFVIKSKYYSLTFLFDSYFGFQDAYLRIMFCTIFFEIVGWYWVFLYVLVLDDSTI